MSVCVCVCVPPLYVCDIGHARNVHTLIFMLCFVCVVYSACFCVVYQIHRNLYKQFCLFEMFNGTNHLGPEKDAVLPAAQGLDPTAEQQKIVYRCISRYTAIINQVFVFRTASWFREVLQEGLGIEDFWYRFEFAKSRYVDIFHFLDAMYSIGKTMGLFHVSCTDPFEWLYIRRGNLVDFHLFI